MRFYEYESKELFRRRGLPLGKGRVATRAEEAREIAAEIGGPVVLKSQVLSGGRMKAGAVQFADTPDECPALFDAILPIEVNGQKARSVLVEEKSPVAQEYFVSVTWDGRRKRPVLLFSDMGGIDIEEVAEKHPEHVSKTHFSTILPPTPRIAKEAIGATLRQFCADRLSDAAVKAQAAGLQREIWRVLAELGVLALATPEGEGGALELVAAVESLGAAVFPGPVAATCFAAQVLSQAERRRVISGEALVAVSDSAAAGSEPRLVPFATQADLFVEVAGDRAFLAEPGGAVEPVDTLGGEVWGRVVLRRGAELAGVARARVVHDLVLAAYTAAAGLRLVDDTAEHAKARRQFGRSIGEFQAVAHPLADSWMQLVSGQELARAAAFDFDAGDLAKARLRAGAARIAAARAGVETAHTCHQLFGAIGITLEGPVFRVSRRLRQLASQPPDDSPAREALLADFGL